MTSIIILIGNCAAGFTERPRIGSSQAKTTNSVANIYFLRCFSDPLYRPVSSHIWSRMHILEDELLSIHSASIVWEIVVLAHFLALHKVGLLAADRTTAGNLQGYTQSVAEVSVEAIKMKDDIYTKLS